MSCMLFCSSCISLADHEYYCVHSIVCNQYGIMFKLNDYSMCKLYLVLSSHTGVQSSTATTSTTTTEGD